MKINLSKLLKNRDLSVSEFAEQSGLGRTTLSKLNNATDLPGKTKTETLITICKALNITLDELVSVRDYTHEVVDVFSQKVSTNDNALTTFVIIKSQTETKLFYSIYSLTATTSFDTQTDLKMEQAKHDLYVETARALGSKYDIKFNFNSASLREELASKIPTEDMSNLQDAERKIAISFDNQYKKYLFSIDMDSFKPTALTQIKKQNSDLYAKIMSYTPLSFDTLETITTDDEIKDLSQQIITKTKFELTNSIYFFWHFTNGYYGEKRTVAFDLTNGSAASVSNVDVRNNRQESFVANQLINHLFDSKKDQ
ncbi:helix-turn-helix transcriptional regulator [Lactobacillus sp. LC28-10]|uniref:Helix-turn-helix transcriptional regulator n=1 Tax=Secundilactobacillus angelensis TaxID=2722706 RepID=A0ABX1L286_9LACO|nr:helix-turn-helix transcriptional regulator [Secundilactobacillus angelensis]MCH5463485.1 helix-turn-helix transcriptional regulator [Secundilactobacillus angelensis]NLR19610.1 helix-turn-helix transcriptional regulator [Secundilactobacillus angelensis]